MCMEGTSFIPLVIANASIPWKSAAFSQYPRMIVSGNMMMGYSIRTDRYRYTEWVFYDDIMYRPLWKGRLYAELYDDVTDPEENNNIAADRRYFSVRKQLSRQLRNGWRMALPGKRNMAFTASYVEL